MWPATQRFLDTLSRSHDAVGAVDLLTGGLPGLATIDGTSDDVVMTGGQVVVGEGIMRRTATVTLIDNAGLLAPVPDRGLLIVGQNEVRLWSGVRYWDATPGEALAGTDTELVPCFTGPITAVDLEDYPIVRLTCSDRAWYLTQPFTTSYTPMAAATLDDTIGSLLAFKIPPVKLTTNIPATNLLTGLLLYDQGSVPADKLVELATAAGWTLYADPMGTWQAVTDPDPATADVDIVYAAGPGGSLIQPKLNYDAQNVVNTWVVTGESADSVNVAVPYAKVTDDNPESTTYVRTPADERPKFISLPTLTTDAQCLLAAGAYKKREVGLADTVKAVVLPNPTHERGDVMIVDGGLVTARTLLADTFTFDVPTTAAVEIAARSGTVSSG